MLLLDQYMNELIGSLPTKPTQLDLVCDNAKLLVSPNSTISMKRGIHRSSSHHRQPPTEDVVNNNNDNNDDRWRRLIPLSESNIPQCKTDLRLMKPQRQSSITAINDNEMKKSNKVPQFNDRLMKPQRQTSITAINDEIIDNDDDQTMITNNSCHSHDDTSSKRQNSMMMMSLMGRSKSDRTLGRTSSSLSDLGWKKLTPLPGFSSSSSSSSNSSSRISKSDSCLVKPQRQTSIDSIDVDVDNDLIMSNTKTTTVVDDDNNSNNNTTTKSTTTTTTATTTRRKSNKTLSSSSPQQQQSQSSTINNNNRRKYQLRSVVFGI